MPGSCINTTWLDGHISSIRKVDEKDWMHGADIKSANWTEKGGYRSVYKCASKK